MRRLLGAALSASWALGCTQLFAATPAFNYTLHCQGCHLADGRETEEKIPALMGVGQFLAVKGGREFLAQVPGVSLSVVSDRELAELLNWMLHRFSAGEIPADFEPYTADEVARYRQNPLVDVETVRANLVATLVQSDHH
jgi:hypothetical protein